MRIFYVGLFRNKKLLAFPDINFSDCFMFIIKGKFKRAE